MSDDLTWLKPKRITSLYTEEEKAQMQPKPSSNMPALADHVRNMERVHRAMESFPVIPDTYKFTGVHPQYGGMGEIPDRLYVTPTEKVRYVYHDGYRRWTTVTTALDSDVWPTPSWVNKKLRGYVFELNSVRAMQERTNYARPNPAGQIPKSDGHIQGIAADPLTEADKRDIKLDKNGNIVMVTHDEMVFEIKKRVNFHTEDCKGTGCQCGRRHAKVIRFTPEIPGFPSVHVSLDPGYVPPELHLTPDNSYGMTRERFNRLKNTSTQIGMPIKVAGKVGEVTRVNSYEEFFGWPCQPWPTRRWILTAEDINMSNDTGDLKDKVRAALETPDWNALSSSERTVKMQAIYDGFNNRQKRTFAKLMGPGYCGVDTTINIDPDYAELEKRTADIMYARYLEECRARVIAPLWQSTETYMLARAQGKTGAVAVPRAASVPPVPTEIALMRDKFCVRLNRLFKGRARVSFPPPRSPDFTVLLKLADNHLIDPPRLTFDFPIYASGDDFSTLEDHVVLCVNIMLDGYKLA